MTVPEQRPGEPGGPPPDRTARAVQESVALDYATPKVTRRAGVVQCVLGAVFTCVAVLGSAFVLLRTGSLASTVWMPVITAVLLGLVATHLRKQPDRRTLAAGMLIGIAIALLLDGMCWLIIVGGRFGG